MRNVKANNVQSPIGPDKKRRDANNAQLTIDPARKRRDANNAQSKILLWALLGSNQRPADYESAALTKTGQFSRNSNLQRLIQCKSLGQLYTKL